jgi:Uma2 family endonuclease
MVRFNPKLRLPTSDELPCSDDTPVDNENQNFLPNLLLFLLKSIWHDRSDWFFGVDMGIYHTTGVSPLVPVVPDGFLSLGVERHKNGKRRKSYVVWEENGIVPRLALEVVSQTPGGEYDTKMEIYANLGVLYYIIYNPEYWQRDRHLPLEVYRLVDGIYQLQIGEPYWMSQIGLGIGRAPYRDGAVEVEALYWYDEGGNRYLTAEERAEQAQQLLDRYRQLFGELPDNR